jgi:hypothetical protein
VTDADAGLLPGFPALRVVARAPQPDRVPAAVLEALTGHGPTLARYLARVHQRGPDACWFWLGAISDTGHGKLRAGSRAAGAALKGDPPSRVVTSHVFGWYLVNGPVGEDSDGSAPLVAHRCDEASCHNPAHWRLADSRGNTAEYMARRADPHGPLADRRGPAGRARAIAQAIRNALSAGAAPAAIEAAIAAAAEQGMPPPQPRLF